MTGMKATFHHYITGRSDYNVGYVYTDMRIAQISIRFSMAATKACIRISVLLIMMDVAYVQCFCYSELFV